MIGGIGRSGHQRALGFARPATIASAVEVPAIDSERSMSADSDLAWLAASDEAVTMVP